VEKMIKILVNPRHIKIRKLFGFVLLFFTVTNLREGNLLAMASQEFEYRNERMTMDIWIHDNQIDLGLWFFFEVISGPLPLEDIVQLNVDQTNIFNIYINGRDDSVHLSIKLNLGFGWQSAEEIDEYAIFLRDMMKEIFNLTNYKSTIEKSSTSWIYLFEPCSAEKLLNYFLEHSPPGFSDTLKAACLNNPDKKDDTRSFLDYQLGGYRLIDDRLMWEITAYVSFHTIFETEIDQTYTISLKDIINIEEVRSSPSTKQSKLYINITKSSSDEYNRYKLDSLSAIPSDMISKEPWTSDYSLTFYSYSKDITGSSIDDLSISFVYVPIHWYDILFEGQTPFYLISALVLAGVCTVWLIVRRRKTKKLYFKLCT
jgi:hypothetical protein